MQLTNLLPRNNSNNDISDVKFGEIIPRNLPMIFPKYSNRTSNDSVPKNLEIIAKNSIFLPRILKNLNILNLGIFKLSKLSLEKEKRLNLEKFSLQEKEYEDRITNSPKKIESKEQHTPSKLLNGSFFDDLFGIGSFLLGAVGLLANKYFSDPKFKNMIDTTFDSLRESLSNSFDKFTKNIFGDGVGEEFKSNLSAIGIGLAAAIAAVKLAMSTFSQIIKSVGKVIAKSIGISIPDTFDTPREKSNPKTHQEKTPDSQDKSERRGVLRKKHTGNDKTRTNKLKDFANKVNRNGWKMRLFNKLKVRFGVTIAMRAVAMIAGMLIPVVGWIAVALAVALTIDDAYAIYEEIFKPNGILDELEKEDSLLGKKIEYDSPIASIQLHPDRTSEYNNSEENTNRPSPIRSSFDYDNYTRAVAKKESSNNYRADNGLGFIGKYQFGAAALETFGYLKPGTSKGNNYAVYSPENWTGKDGINNSFDFMNSPDVQEKLMSEYTKSHYRQLQKSGVITDASSDTDIAAALYAAHHGGVGGANKYYLRGEDTRDVYLPSESIGKSAKYMESEYNKGKYISENSRQIEEIKEKQNQNIQYVDASSTTNMQGGGSNQPVQLTHAKVADEDFMGMLLRNMWS